MEKQITKRHLTIVSFAAGAIFGLLHIVNAIAGGLIFKSIFLKTGSLFYCILLHFLVDISRMGTVFPNSSQIYASVLTFIYLIYGVYESIHMDETTVTEWNRKLKRANSDLVEKRNEEII